MTRLPLSDLVEIQAGYATRGRVELDPDGEYALLQVSDLDAAGFDPDDLDPVRVATGRSPGPLTPSPRHTLHENDVLFATRGAHNRAVLVNVDYPHVAADAHLFILRVDDRERLRPDYLAWYLNGPPAQAHFDAYATGSHIRRVNRGALEALELPLPPLDTQREIATAGRLAVEEAGLLHEIAERRLALIQTTLLQTLTTQDTHTDA